MRGIGGMSMRESEGGIVLGMFSLYADHAVNMKIIRGFCIRLPSPWPQAPRSLTPSFWPPSYSHAPQKQGHQYQPLRITSSTIRGHDAARISH